MRPIPISTIAIPKTRQRRAFDGEALHELAQSIQRNGLLHPIVVRFEEGKPVLVAGERRLRAVEILELQHIRYRCGKELVPEGHIPANELGELAPDEAWEAELEENLQRVDLTWQERTEAIANLHRLKEARAGRMLQPTETAQEILGKDTNPVAASQAVRRALILNAHLEDPLIAKARSEKDAWKLIKKKENDALYRALAAKAAEEESNLKVIQGDCREVLPSLPDNTFDCIITDPPYGINADEFGDAGGRLTGTTHQYKDTPEHAIALMRAVIPQFYRLAKAEAHLYIFCDIEHFLTIREIAREAGWTPFRTPLIYVRPGNRAPWPGYGPRRSYELVLYAMKGKRAVLTIGDDVFEPARDDNIFGHGAGKPVDAYVQLLKRSCRPGDAILDAFAGSGTVLAAAHQLSLRAVAIEVDPTYYGMCISRLEALKK